MKQLLFEGVVKQDSKTEVCKRKLQDEVVGDALGAVSVANLPLLAWSAWQGLIGLSPKTGPSCIVKLCKPGCTQNSKMQLASLQLVMHKLLAADFCASRRPKFRGVCLLPTTGSCVTYFSPVHLLLHLLVEPHRLLAAAVELGHLVLGDGGGGEAGRGGSS